MRPAAEERSTFDPDDVPIASLRLVFGGTRFPVGHVSLPWRQGEDGTDRVTRRRSLSRRRTTVNHERVTRALLTRQNADAMRVLGW